MANKRVSIVQKATYGVLVIPVVWLLFSIWAVTNDAFSRYAYSVVSDIKASPSVSESFNVVLYGLGTLWALVKIVQNIKNHAVVSAELKSIFAFLLGSTITAINTFFQVGRLMAYVGIAVLDIAPIIMLVTLLQGKPFGPLTLYHKDVQIAKVP